MPVEVQYHKDEIVFPSFIHSEYTLYKYRKVFLGVSIILSVLQLVFQTDFLDLDSNSLAAHISSVSVFASLCFMLYLATTLVASKKILELEKDIQDKHKTLHPDDFQLNVSTLQDFDKLKLSLTLTEKTSMQMFTSSIIFANLALFMVLFTEFYSRKTNMADVETHIWLAIATQACQHFIVALNLLLSTMKVYISHLPVAFLIWALIVVANLLASFLVEENTLDEFNFFEFANESDVSLEDIEIDEVSVEIGISAGAVIASFFLGHFLVILRSSLYFRCRKPLMRLLSNATNK